MTPSDLISLWNLNLPHATTSAPFVRLLSENQLPDKNFDTWLFNDFLYVRCGTFFLARLITSTPDTHPIKSAQLIPAYEVLKRELEVFREKALARNITLPKISSADPDFAAESAKATLQILGELVEHSAKGCTDYMKFMTETLLDEKKVHWSTLLTVIWILEKVYLDVMVHVRDSPAFDQGADEVLKDFVRWWANDEFSAWVDALGEAVVELREGEESGFNEEEAKWAAREVVMWERGFWDIATEGLDV
ncbi:heme oxygenase-like protein [Choiromyces venosus 120613-1]|uniref:Heme oxygenase-like protein n=1 Tax=Choiromyces venosus 120613-1 TaxID=1336337 RepID=A0A3N4JEP3_9PEZI|nr:heme oxygenase-like protein [Choiromyces venosus 120613-1]